jgi:D-alanine-D-alanine ligase-like ATP-grasp enzyme
MTDHSLVPMSAAALGISFDDLVMLILDGKTALAASTEGLEKS